MGMGHALLILPIFQFAQNPANFIFFLGYSDRIITNHSMKKVILQDFMQIYR